MCVDQYFTTKEVTALIKVTRRTLMNWVEDGRIEATYLPTGQYGKPGIRFTASAVNACLSKRAIDQYERDKKRAIKNNDATRS